MAYIHCVSGGGGATFEEVWTNPNPSANSFANQTVSIDLSVYDYVCVAAKGLSTSSNTIGADNEHSIGLFPVPCSSAEIACFGQNIRTLNVTTSGVQFASATNTMRAIPIKIYGVKGLSLT